MTRLVIPNLHALHKIKGDQPELRRNEQAIQLQGSGRSAYDRVANIEIAINTGSSSQIFREGAR
ncbi:hypothetical protein C7E19_24480 [Stenotrophomonas maltophilia]|nr:hypothetical protein C7E19_24480 [Stenotrophomonas maltophilia]